MSRAIAVLRPEPGNRVTAAAIEARGRRAIRLPLFDVRPVAWQIPAAEDFDALILTSANALRHGGPGLSTLHRLPVHAVGKATADAARRAGFDVAHVGEDGAAALLAEAEAAGIRRALHLAGRERTIAAGGIVGAVRTVYASEPRTPEALTGLAGSIALVQSARAAAWLAELVDAAGIDRGGIALVAVSAPAAAAAGGGWEQLVVPRTVSSEAMIAAAIALAD
ncbi:uroporphyrinogen-III synthase [Sphingomonas naasensis]|uniref:Uroporphyrinogen-III synthase n=1 Tax=Sphingomonas naasensis TaxID=1344951 RepID=A0A4S1WBN0_9SPHN|nr:uroporphyrinogen-III synthase [Sphingomonas naasensis]NIJ21328.1 uroporphyrinogen-III synthase [Sphingomonas naasensis]TGX38760.1 uroporphyrinogen-III synthase [Sphingomonas naasensis]